MITINLWGALLFIEYSFLILFAGGFLVSYSYISRRTVEAGESIISWSFAAAVFVAVSLMAHEAGHAVSAYILGIEIKFFAISWWGAYVNLSVSHQDLLPWQDFFISAAGPFVNIVLGIVLNFRVKRLRQSAKKSTIQFIKVYNVFTGLFNLLPIGITDGFWILSDLLKIFGGL